MHSQCCCWVFTVHSNVITCDCFFKDCINWWAIAAAGLPLSCIGVDTLKKWLTACFSLQLQGLQEQWRLQSHPTVLANFSCALCICHPIWGKPFASRQTKKKNILSMVSLISVYSTQHKPKTPTCLPSFVKLATMSELCFKMPQQWTGLWPNVNGSVMWNHILTIRKWHSMPNIFLSARSMLSSYVNSSQPGLYRVLRCRWRMTDSLINLKD